MPQAIQCIGPSYTLSDRKSAVQRAVNLYMRQIEGLGENKQVVLDSAPGLALFLDLGADVRGMYSTGSRLFAVAGSTLYELTSGAAVNRGSLLSFEGYVAFKHGTSQMVLVDGDNGYVFNLHTSTLTTITDTDWRGSEWVEELNGTFIFVDPGTDQPYLSAIDDALTFDALDFTSADSQPDNITAFRVMKQEVYFFGDWSTEVWIYTGDTDFPLTRYNATPIDVGCVGKRAAINAADTLYWVGQTRTGTASVYEMRGHQPFRVSNQAVEEALTNCDDISAVTMWTYKVKGNEFIGINAPGFGATWVYDASTQQWHERAELLDGEYTMRRDDLVTLFSGTHYCAAGTKVYKLQDTVYTLDGDPLVRERTWPHLPNPSYDPITFPGLEIQCTTGSGGSITLELSNDGGYTWGAPLIRSLGAVGRWLQRVRWAFLGSAVDRVFRLRVTDDVPLTIHGASIQ